MEMKYSKQGKYTAREMEVIEVLVAIHRRIMAASSQRTQKKSNSK